jgi:hypothetical protein
MHHILQRNYGVIRKYRFYCNGSFPVFEPKHLIESRKEYPVSLTEKCVSRLIAFGFNQRSNRGNHYERRKNNKTIRRKNAK